MMHAVQRFRLDRIPDNLLREPLDFLVADHVRQRKVCNGLDLLLLGSQRTAEASGYSEGDVLEAIFTYLSSDFPLHIADKEIDIFPLLRSPRHRDDEVDDLIGTLKRHNATELSLARDIAGQLQQMKSAMRGKPRPSNFAELSMAFVEQVRRRLAIEEGILLPFARKHLSPADLTRIGHAMAARRNIDYPC